MAILRSAGWLVLAFSLTWGMVEQVGPRDPPLLDLEDWRGDAVTLATLMHWTANRRRLVVLTVLTFVTMC